MNDTLEYKGYHARIQFDGDDKTFYGVVNDLQDIVTFEGQSVDELTTAFRDSVDEYLRFCKQRGEQPEKPCSGRILLRIKPALHRNLTSTAKKRGMSVNAFIEAALESKVAKNTRG